MAEPAAPTPYQGGELLICGGTDWANLGRSGTKGKKTPQELQEEIERQNAYPNLMVPNRIKSLMGVRIAWVASGCAAVHAIAGDMEGKVYTWGRNEKGQLGVGDLRQRNVPTLVQGLAGKDVVTAAGGKVHSVFVTKSGESWACGSNAVGQCGIGAIRTRTGQEDLLLVPQRALIEKARTVSCGADFTVWLCDGEVYSAGNPQYGQLGDGSDHEYNARDSSIKLMHDPQPTPKLLTALKGKKITGVTCGTNHSIAIDDAGAAYSWGNGGYGRLGHKVQQDEFSPRAIETFRGRLVVPADSPLAAGGTSSFCTIVGGQLMGWGKLKTSGDNTMYPSVMYDLQGWNIRSIAAGPSTFAVAADDCVITWGAASNGELGYGTAGKKSSANPGKCEALSGGVHTHQVACGSGFTLFLSDPESEKVKASPVWEPVVEIEPDAPPADAKAAKAKAPAKRKAPAGGGAKAKKAAK